MAEGAWTPTLDLAAPLAWLDPDLLLKRLISDIEAQQPKGVSALSVEAKAEKLKWLATELSLTEREEEFLIELSEEEGPAIARRLEMDPAAILGLIPGKRKADIAA